MKVPAYVQALLGQARFEFVLCKANKDYAVGYTISIRKRSDYQTAKVFQEEIKKLQKWVNRQPGGEMIILSLPKETHHCGQYAIVTIFDPVMKEIERYIKK